VELKGLRRGVLGKKESCSAADMFASLKGGSGEEDWEEHLSVRRGRVAYERLMPMIDRLFPIAGGEPEVTDCGPTHGVVPAVVDELKTSISRMKDEEFPYSLEEMRGWIAEKKARIRAFLELTEVGTKDCAYRVWGESGEAGGQARARE